MAFYIKVTREVADKLGVAGIRNSTADGNVLLWQADVAGFPGDTVFDRAAVVGGVCLSPQQAKGEIDAWKIRWRSPLRRVSWIKTGRR